MKKIVLKRIFHRDGWRYAIFFEKDPALISIAKNIPGAKFSNSHSCWYTDETEENLRLILQHFRDKADIDISSISSRSPAPPLVDNEEDQLVNQVLIRQEIDEESEESDTSPEEHPVITHKGRLDPVEFRLAGNGRLIVRFTGYYDKSWIDEIKTYGKVYYDRIHKEFLLRWSELTVHSLSDYFAGKGIPVRVIKPKVDDETKESRKSFGEEVRSRELSKEGHEAVGLLLQHLSENRYSTRTIETYITLLELFFKFFNSKSPGNITQNDVSDFMNDFIIKNGFSGSYQNQMISAIKLYYEIAGKGKVIPQFLERPRRGRALPKVFSKDEVTRILNSARNTKHKLLLWIIYSCGLRRSEVTNIRLTDIDRTRNLIHIREGKGGVDRIVPVPDKLWSKLDEYVAGYHPKDYLFEGQSGRRYSGESVYNVFRQALRKAGIKKEVGVHCLRHSYATHLHENGLDIRYIQELLGHKSTRTTEIYTHVSRRNLVAVRSPIEDLEVK